MYSLLFENELLKALRSGRPRLVGERIRELRDVCQRVPPPPWEPGSTPRKLLSYFADERFLTLYGLEAVHHGFSIAGVGAWCWQELLDRGFEGTFPGSQSPRFPFPAELAYEQDLRQPPAMAAELEERFAAHCGHPVAYVRRWGAAKAEAMAEERAGRPSGKRDRTRWEGATQVDARAVWPDGLVGGEQRLYVEAKFLSDVSVSTSYNRARNQIVRTVEAGLWDTTLALSRSQQPVPTSIATEAIEHAWFLLVTPRVFKEGRWSRARLFGYLMREYGDDPRALQRDLHHLHLPDDAWVKLAGRIGWATWEDVRQVVEMQQLGRAGERACRLPPALFDPWRTFWDERCVGHPRRVLVFRPQGIGEPIDYHGLDDLRESLRDAGYRRLRRLQVDRLTDGEHLVGDSFTPEELNEEHLRWLDAGENRYLSA